MSAALSSESHPMKLLNQIMERAALNNFKYMYSKLWEEEKAEEGMMIEDQDSNEN